MIEVRHLRIVDAIARAGTATEAARRLHLTQPAVSHALGELEGRLGVQLFSREHGGMIATAEGKRLLETAAVVLEEVSAAEHDLRQLKDGVTGVIRITTQCYTCYHWLPPVITHFGREFPGVEVRLETAGTAHPVERLLDGTVDIAIVHDRTESTDVLYRPLFDDEIVAIVGAGHPLAGRKCIQPADLRDQVLFLHTDPEGAAIITEFLGPAGIHPPRVSPLQLTEAVVAVVQAGLGVSAVARWVVEPQLAQGSLVALRLGKDGLRRTWHAGIRRRDRGRKALAALVEVLRDRSRFGATRSPGPDT